MVKTLKSWRISVLRKKGEYFGTLEVPDEATPLKVSIKDFDVKSEWQGRLRGAARRLTGT